MTDQDVNAGMYAGQIVREETMTVGTGAATKNKKVRRIHSGDTDNDPDFFEEWDKFRGRWVPLGEAIQALYVEDKDGDEEMGEGGGEGEAKGEGDSRMQGADE